MEITPELYAKIFPPRKKEPKKAGRPRLYSPEESKQLRLDRTRQWQLAHPERVREIQNAYNYRRKEEEKRREEQLEKLEEENKRLREQLGIGEIQIPPSTLSSARRVIIIRRTD